MMEETSEKVAPPSDGKEEKDVEAEISFDASVSESKGHGGTGETMTAGKLRIKMLAMAEYLRSEISKCDKEKVKQLGIKASAKCIELALALKALMLQYYQQVSQIDRQKVYQDLRTMDRAKAKERSLSLLQKAKTGYQGMSQARKMRYGMFAGLFIVVAIFNSPAPRGGHKRDHPNLCYIRSEVARDIVKPCEKMLKPVVKGMNRWIFIGNEPSLSLFGPFHQHQTPKQDDGESLFIWRKGDGGNREKNKFYYELPNADQDEWTAKYLAEMDQEHPTEIAKDFAQSDCKRCVEVKLKARHKDLTVENLVVETSRDVNIPTKTTITTQETIVKYIENNYPNRAKTVCVVQQGIFEMDRAPWRTTEEYLANTQEFHRMLEQQCGVLIRFGIFPNSRLEKKIDEWDHGTRDLVLDYSRNGYFVDVGNVNSPTEEFYINPVWEMITRLMEYPIDIKTKELLTPKTK